MRVRLRDGNIVEARLAQVDQQMVLQLATRPISSLRPAEAHGIPLVEATPAEKADLRAYGFVFQDENQGQPLNNPMMRLLIPVGRSGWAIAAGYAGFFAMLIIPAPLAILLSCVAIWHLRKNPDLHGWPRAIFGLVLGLFGSMILVYALLHRGGGGESQSERTNTRGLAAPMSAAP